MSVTAICAGTAGILLLMGSLGSCSSNKPMIERDADKPIPTVQPTENLSLKDKLRAASSLSRDGGKINSGVSFYQDGRAKAVIDHGERTAVKSQQDPIYKDSGLKEHNNGGLSLNIEYYKPNKGR